MPQLKVAHIQDQGIDLIIVLMDSSFGYRGSREQNQTTAEIQLRAKSAGLAGIVVPVWVNAGHLEFLAPRDWQPFFSGLTPEFVASKINRELCWRGQTSFATWLPERAPRTAGSSVNSPGPAPNA
jgi:hypothetical protein